MPLVSDMLWQGLRKFHAMTRHAESPWEKQSDRQIFSALSDDDGGDHVHGTVAKWSSSRPGCLNLPVKITLLGVFVAKAFSCTNGTPLAECMQQNTE